MTELNCGFDENVYDLNAILHPGSVFGQAGPAEIDRAHIAGRLMDPIEQIRRLRPRDLRCRPVLTWARLLPRLA